MIKTHWRKPTRRNGLSVQYCRQKVTRRLKICTYLRKAWINLARKYDEKKKKVAKWNERTLCWASFHFLFCNWAIVFTPSEDYCVLPDINSYQHASFELEDLTFFLFLRPFNNGIVKRKWIQLAKVLHVRCTDQKKKTTKLAIRPG